MDFGPLLLFLGLLTVVNAPFDWFSLGLTRLLLRLGLQHRGWWPYVYAALDAAVAVVIIALLAVAMLLAMQCFDDVATRAGGRATLDLPLLLDSIQTHPGHPENYWVYVTLFSTMIPSLLNLFFGGVALTRCMPGLRRWLLGKMPPSGAIARANIEGIANLLVLQLYLGVGLAVLAQGVLFFGLIGYALPLFGFDLLDQCRALVAADLPGQALRLLFGP